MADLPATAGRESQSQESLLEDLLAGSSMGVYRPDRFTYLIVQHLIDEDIRLGGWKLLQHRHHHHHYRYQQDGCCMPMPVGWYRPYPLRSACDWVGAFPAIRNGRSTHHCSVVRCAVRTGFLFPPAIRNVVTAEHA